MATGRFVIIAQARTGSTLLISSLAQHPDIQCRGEILNAGHGYTGFSDDGRQRIHDAWRPVRPCRTAGVKLLCHQPWGQDPESWATAWDELAELSDVKIIVLRREDRLAQLASWKVANTLGRWKDQPQHDRPVVDVSPDELRWFRQWNDQLMHERLRRLTQHETLEVEYESLCSDWPAEIARVQQFLGVEVQPLEQARRKSEHRPLSKVIATYGQMRDN